MERPSTLCHQPLAISHVALLRFLVIRVLSTEAAVLRKLQPLRRLLLVLRRAVVAPLAHRARERNDISHKSPVRAQGSGQRALAAVALCPLPSALLDDLAHCAGTDGSAAFTDGEARAFLER